MFPTLQMRRSANIVHSRSILPAFAVGRCMTSKPDGPKTIPVVTADPATTLKFLLSTLKDRSTSPSVVRKQVALIMKLHRAKLSTPAFTTLISALGRAELWRPALELFELMVIDKRPRNTITYNAAISACEKGGQWEKALGLLAEMERTGVQRNTITYSAVIEAAYSSGQVECCMTLLDEAIAAGLLLLPIRTSGWVCDLHYFPKAVALTFVRRTLSCRAPGTVWTFIIGLGKLAVDLGFRVTGQLWCGAAEHVKVKMVGQNRCAHVCVCV
jgi:pentatricopeptide repeat protein